MEGCKRKSGKKQIKYGVDCGHDSEIQCLFFSTFSGHIINFLNTKELALAGEVQRGIGGAKAVDRLRGG